jgi:uncharacterized membrane protein YfcA
LELALFSFGVAAFGALAGGIAGVGAVLIIAPLLYFGAPLMGTPLDFKAVSNLTTFSVLVSSIPAVWVYNSFGLVRREIVVPMLLPATLGALVGVFLAIVVPSSIVQATFALAAIAGSALVLVPYKSSNDDLARTLDLPRAGLVATAASVGVVGGITGAGGGYLLVPLLLGAFKLPTRVAIGTAGVSGGLIAGVSFIGRLTALHINWSLLVAVAAGAVLGTAIGTRVQQRVPTAIIRRAVAIVVAVAAIKMLLQLR